MRYIFPKSVRKFSQTVLGPSGFRGLRGILSQSKQETPKVLRTFGFSLPRPSLGPGLQLHFSQTRRVQGLGFRVYPRVQRTQQ